MMSLDSAFLAYERYVNQNPRITQQNTTNDLPLALAVGAGHGGLPTNPLKADVWAPGLTRKAPE